MLTGLAQTVWSAADPTDFLQAVIDNTLSYDSNLFRLSDQVDISAVSPVPDRWDVINQTTAGFKSYLPISRQTLKFGGNIGYQAFANHDYLDNVNGNANVNWDWQAGNYWNGTMAYGYTKALGGFTNTNYFGRDMISNNTTLFEANYWFHPSWRINGQYIWMDSRHSADQRKYLDLNTNTGVGGIYYQSTEKQDSYLGIRFRHTNGVQPHNQLDSFSLVDNSFLENEIVAAGTWTLTGKSHLAGDVGWIQRQQVEFSARNFQGITWHLDYRWSPSEITSVNLTTYRELRSFQDLTANYIVVDGVSLDPRWSISPKLSLVAKGAWEQWSYAGNPAILLGAKERRDNIWYGQVTVNYEIIRNAAVSLSFQTTQRTSNKPFFDYSDNLVFASIGYRF